MLVNNFLEQSAKSYPNKVSLICQNRNVTFSEIDRSANSIGNAFVEKGLQRQDRVVIYLENSIETVVSLFGILKANAIFVVINPQVKANKLEYILKDCQARILITDTDRLAKISEIVPRCTDLKLVLCTGDEVTGAPIETINGTKIFSYKALLERYPPIKPIGCCIDIDLASLVYTSGSTGNPKGVMLTHLNMVTAATSIIKYLENTISDIILDTLPLAFDYGLYQVLMAMKFGGTVILEKAFVYPYQVINSIKKNRVTGLPLVPTMVAILLKLTNLGELDLPDLRYITSTGQALPPSHITRLQDIFPKVKIYSMYGLTECKRVSYLVPKELTKRPSSVGKAIPNTEVYLVDNNDKKIAEAGKPGELVVRGATIMKGYWNLPQETAKALRSGPYPGEKVLYTGDLFKKDEEDYLYFLGRKDEMFKSSGELVSPKEIENAICENQHVVDAAVIGVEDAILGRAVKAFVVLSKDSQIKENDVIRFCSERLESYMIPKFVVFLQSLPKSSTGKTMKSELK